MIVLLYFRRISLAYSCISLIDVAKKLCLESPKEAEYIIAKVSVDEIFQLTKG